MQKGVSIKGVIEDIEEQMRSDYWNGQMRLGAGQALEKLRQLEEQTVQIRNEERGATSLARATVKEVIDEILEGKN